MSILQRANKTSRNLFQSYRFAANRIHQSKPVEINRKQYILVGQLTDKHAPVITNYIVYDTSRQMADPSLAKKVYTIVSSSVMMEGLLALDDLFLKQEKIEAKDGMTPIPQQAESAWTSNRLAYEKWLKNQPLTESHWLQWQAYWTDFWQVYEARAVELLKLPKNQIQEPYKKKETKDPSKIMINEARLIASLFILKDIPMQGSPKNLAEWISFNSDKALAPNRRVTISTKADIQSEQITKGFGYILMLGIILPFFLYRTYVDGGEHIFFLCLFFAIYIALYYTNKYRLRKSIQVRLADIWNQADQEKNIPIFNAKATSVNMGVAVFYVSFATMLIFGSFWYIYGFKHGITIFTFILMLFTITFNLWFLYSPFVEKDVTFYVHQIRAGHRLFPKEDIWQISVDKDYITYTIYLTYTKEPYEVYIEKDYRQQMKEFMPKWCQGNDIPFTLLNEDN